MTNTPTTMNNPRTVFGWAMFDWANSAYALVIAVAIFPGYYTANTTPMITLGGIDFPNSSIYAYCVTLAYLILAIFSPLLSGIADYSGKKKLFLQLFTFLGAMGCGMLFLFEGMPTLWWGLGGFTLSTMGFAGGLVFYNAYLPEIVTEERYDSVSARGFSFGYGGSLLLLIFCLFMILNPVTFGIVDTKMAARISYILVAVWWIVFSQYSFRLLPPDSTKMVKGDYFREGFNELKKTWETIRQNPYTKTFLWSFFFFNAGVQSIIFLAATFAEKELKFQPTELIITIIILQVLGLVGAYLAAKISDKIGNKNTIIILLVGWIIVAFAAFLVQEKIQFYIVAVLVGMVMGGIQSMSRSTYSKLLPEDTPDTTSFFSFMDVMDKFSVIIGTFSFGIVEQLTGNIRYSVLVMGLLFVIGLVLMMKIKIAKK